jgi:hypothetical protein
MRNSSRAVSVHGAARPARITARPVRIAAQPGSNAIRAARIAKAPGAAESRSAAARNARLDEVAGALSIFASLIDQGGYWPPSDQSVGTALIQRRRRLRQEDLRDLLDGVAHVDRETLQVRKVVTGAGEAEVESTRVAHAGDVERDAVKQQR